MPTFATTTQLTATLSSSVTATLDAVSSSAVYATTSSFNSLSSSVSSTYATTSSLTSLSSSVSSTYTPVSSTVASWSGSSGTIRATNAIEQTDLVNLQSLTRAGFPNRVDSAFTFVTGTRVLTLAATGTSFDYWSNNKRYTITGTQITLPAATGSEQYIFFNSAGQLTSSASPWIISSDQTAPVALVYWGMTGQSATLADERHSAYRDRFNHRYLHNTRGTAYDNGLSATFFAGNSGTFSFTSGRIWDEDIDWNITGTTINARFWVRSGSAMRFLDNATSSWSGTTAAPLYDLAGVPTVVPNTQYFNAWFYGTTEYNYPISIVMGQGQYNTVQLAGAEPEPSIPGRSTREWKLLYQAVYRLNAGTTTFQSATDYRGAVTLPGQGTANTLPATQVTYVPSSPLTSINAQGALDQLANLTQPVYGGLFADYGLAVSGGVGDPTMALTSGVFTAVSATLTGAISGVNGFVSSSVSDGRIYVSSAGTYFVHCDLSFEVDGNTLNHIGLFLTGTENGKWSQASDMTTGDSDQMSISAIIPMVSGNYVDLRIRPSTNRTATIHHFNFEIMRIAPAGY